MNRTAGAFELNAEASIGLLTVSCRAMNRGITLTLMRIVDRDCTASCASAGAGRKSDDVSQPINASRKMGAELRERMSVMCKGSAEDLLATPSDVDRT